MTHHHFGFQTEAECISKQPAIVKHVQMNIVSPDQFLAVEDCTARMQHFQIEGMD